MSSYNIVLITIDCLRYDRCGFNGCVPSPTPFLDSLAEEALVWDAAYATGPMTPESIPGILSGLHSYNSAQFSDDLALKSIPAGQPTVASWLSDCGYSTRAILTNSQLTVDRNYNIGFDTFINPTGETATETSQEESNDETLQKVTGGGAEWFS